VKLLLVFEIQKRKKTPESLLNFLTERRPVCVLDLVLIKRVLKTLEKNRHARLVKNKNQKKEKKKKALLPLNLQI
jgi:hypothetical protein